MALSRLSAKCSVCPYVETCDHKEMEAVGYLPEPITAQASAPVLEDMAAPILVKHDYRDIKIGENTTVTIDLEEMKRKMVEDFYAGIHRGLHGMLMSGA